MNLKDISPWNWSKDSGIAKNKKYQDQRHPLTSLQHEVDVLFNKFFEEFDMHFPEKDLRAHNGSLLYPKTDISETERSYKVALELPGVERKDIQMSVMNNHLVIRGVKNHKKEEKQENFHKIERVYGSFERIISLPDNVSDDNIIAELRDGVLYVELGKKTIGKAEVKHIDIK